METTRKTHDNGGISQTNWMLGEVIHTCKKYSIEHPELIKELAIQKIEYGRTCLAQFLAQGGQTRQTMKGFFENMDSELQKRIIELGGNPSINVID